MFFVLFVLHNSEYCEDVLNAWESCRVSGVTILPSTGLKRIQDRALKEEMPLLPSLEDFFSTQENGNRTLFTILPDEEQIDMLVKATEGVIGKLDEPDTGILVVLPVLRSYGIKK